jgi:predicted  nucleic acid-binding Zn-ribbon protein
MSRAKVSEAKFAGFEVKFHSPDAPKTRGQAKTQTETQLPTFSETELASIEQETNEVLEAKIRQEQVDTMMIADPLQYEYELMHGEEIIDAAEEPSGT